jgi:hypothetical protein
MEVFMKINLLAIAFFAMVANCGGTSHSKIPQKEAPVEETAPNGENQPEKTFKLVTSFSELESLTIQYINGPQGESYYLVGEVHDSIENQNPAENPYKVTFDSEGKGAVTFSKEDISKFNLTMWDGDTTPADALNIKLVKVAGEWESPVTAYDGMGNNTILPQAVNQDGVVVIDLAILNHSPEALQMVADGGESTPVTEEAPKANEEGVSVDDKEDEPTPLPEVVESREEETPQEQVDVETPEEEVTVPLKGVKQLYIVGSFTGAGWEHIPMECVGPINVEGLCDQWMVQLFVGQGSQSFKFDDTASWEGITLGQAGDEILWGENPDNLFWSQDVSMNVIFEVDLINRVILLNGLPLAFNN